MIERIKDLILIRLGSQSVDGSVLYIISIDLHISCDHLQSYILGEIAQFWHITWRLVRLHYLREIKVFTFAPFTQISIESPGEIQSLLII